jgi:hypothetical protein
MAVQDTKRLVLLWTKPRVLALIARDIVTVQTVTDRVLLEGIAVFRLAHGLCNTGLSKKMNGI